MSIQPYIRGGGRAGQAAREAWLLLRALDPELRIGEPTMLPRGELAPPRKSGDATILTIATPHGLHARAIAEAEARGFDGIACEKPVCVRPEELALLDNVRTKTAVFHVYRQLWGPRRLRQMIDAGEFGEVISFEGRYWQSSTAERALAGNNANSWKNDPELSGPSDAFLDVGVHWLDLAVFLAGERPSEFSRELTFANAEQPHRDSHAWVRMMFPRGARAFASISKNVHGATNHFEMNVLGTKKSAAWTFLRPDEIFVGEGRQRSVLTRTDTELGSHHPPFHALGWLEGYVEILRQLSRDVLGLAHEAYPNLAGSLDLMRTVFSVPN